MKHAIVSGGTKGMGRALCELLLEKGWKVFTSARAVDEKWTHPNLFQFKADLSSKTEVYNFAQWIKDQVNSADLLVNNVGTFIPGSILGEDDGVFEAQMGVNLASTYHLTRATIDLIRNGQKPHIVNICSTASTMAYKNGGSYCISKHGQLGLTKVLREELKPENISVTAVLPGATNTSSWEGSGLPDDRFIDPNSVAQLIWSIYQLPESAVTEEILVRPMLGDIT